MIRVSPRREVLCSADGEAWDVFVREVMPYWREKSDKMISARKQRNARASAKRKRHGEVIAAASSYLDEQVQVFHGM